MKYLLIVIVGLAALGIVACGSSDDGGGEPDESSLREAVTKYVNDLQRGEPLRAYTYADDSYKENCDAATFAGLLILLDAFIGESWRDAETRIDSVEIDGNRATVVYDLYLDDTALGFGESDNYWVHDGDNWRFATDDPDPCGISDSSESPTDTPEPDDDPDPAETPPATQEPPASSRTDPIPIGTPVTLSDGWTVTVLSSTPDATDAILDENPFNDPPEPGAQFFIARISGTYNGEDESTTLDASFRFKAVGASSVTYEQFSSSCGVIPDEIESYVEVFQGGTIEGSICWQIDASDATSLVMFDDPFTFGDPERVWLAVLP